MNKKGVIKLSVGIILLLAFLILIFSSFFSSASETDSFSLGDEVKIDLSQYESCSLKIKTPSNNIIQDVCQDKFSLKFEEPGEYVVIIKSLDSSERLEFQVSSDRENFMLFNFEKENSYPIWSTLKFDLDGLGNYELLITSPSGKKTSRVGSNDLFFFDILEEGVYSIKFERGNAIKEYRFTAFSDNQKEEPIQSKAEINKPVLWNKNLDKPDTNNLFELPNTLNLTLKKVTGEIFNNYDLVNIEGKKYLKLKENLSEDLILEYFTESPKIEEKLISENKKEVVISSPEDVHYQEVLSYTSLPREISNQGLIKVYWKEQDIYLNFEAEDTNGNSLLDYIKWIVPHLSNQTFEIIITKAEHLDSSRTFISDIYEQVKELDNLWSEIIDSNEYVRVTFEFPLDNTRDITLFPRVLSGNPKIEVYEKDRTEKVAEFSSLIPDEYNKVLLTNLIGLQDTFDLKVIGGSIELDHIIDPQITYNVNSSMRAYWGRPTSSNRWLSGTNSTSSQYANMATENTVYASVGPTSNNDYPFYRFNFTIDTPVAYINSIYIRFTGYDNAGETGTVYVWRFANSTWMPIGTTPAANGNVTRNITSDISSYIDSNKQVVIIVEGDQYDTSPSVDYLYVDYVGVTVQYTSETTPPIYNRVSVNNTLPEEITRFSINVSDNVALHPNGGYIFSTNNTGSWENDSFVLFTTTPSWANVTKTLTSTAETFVGYRWYFNDSENNRNSTQIYNLTVSPYPPSGAQIQCEEEGSWKDCNEVEFSEILTRVRINCTGNVINASFNLTNLPDSYNFFSSNATSNESTWWIYDNNDLTINDSGTFNLTGTCYGPSSQAKNFVNWTLPWGNLTVSLVNPSSNINVNEKEFFNFTANVTCTGGECGFVNATLDPAGSWWNTDYENRKLINITNPSSSVLVQNYSMVIVVDTTGIDFQDDGDDLRIIYWNGTHNIELDRFNDSFFNLATTNIWFRIQSDISSGSYDDNYYIYYNNSEASNPPNNGSKVFEFFDDFNRANSTTIGNGWTETTGTWEIINNWVRNTLNGDSDLTRTTTTTNHSIRALANQVITDADLKLSIRSSLSPTGGYTYGYQNGQLEITSGNHNTANLGSTAISTMAGVPYELELNAFGSRITAYKDGSLIFNVTSTAATSGFTLLHSWDVSEFDDFWIRKLMDIEPTYSLGNSEKRSKGMVSTVIGSTPFYTTSRNPMDSIGRGCLDSMKAGTTCNVTWQVNASGKLGSTWSFFVFANTTNYTNYFNSTSISSIINITIGNLPPEIPELNFPANNSALTSIGEFNWSNSLDPTGDTVYYGIEISNSSDFSYLFYSNYSITEQETITGITPTGITLDGKYYWRVLATDLKANSSWSETRIFYYDLSPPTVYSVSPENFSNITYSNTINFIFNVSDLSNIAYCNLIVNESIKDTSYSITKDVNSTFVYLLPNSFYSWKINCTDSAGRVGESGLRFLNIDVSNNPPVAREIECEKNSIWYNCTSIAFGDTLTRMRVRCTDPEEIIVNASLNLTNVPDSYTYFSDTSFSWDAEQYLTFDNPDIKINDSGMFKIMATCYDNESLTNTNSTNWTVPWGSLSITLLNPNSDTSVMKDSFFTFNSRISCISGECGNINVTLDPLNWWNDTWDYRKTLNITNSGSTTLSNFPIYINVSKESEMQTDFEDIRFINGSCGSSGTPLQLSYEIENYTSSKADVWVNIPSFVPGINQICMYYGNSFVSSGQDSINTWNYNYMTVQHLEEVGTGTRYDSTFRRNFTTSGYEGDEKTTGKVDGADILDGTNDALNSTSNFLSNSASFTLEGWIKPRAWGSRVSLYGQNDAIEFFLDGTNTIMIWTTGGGSTSTAYSYSLDTWHYLVAVGTGTNLILYLDGSQVVSGGTSTANYGSSAYAVKIGEGVVDASGGFFNGSIDEVRISNTTRSADWINQSYQLVQNQNTFVNWSDKEEKTKGVISTVVGTSPFYTTTPNPLNDSTISCLGNMKSSGGYCNLNWSVNATGELNSVWEFFVSANNLNYTEYFNTSGESSRIHITIAGQVPPTVPQLYLPLNATAYASIPNLNWTNSTDQNGDMIYYIVQVSNLSDFSTIVFANYSIPERANPTNITPTGITLEGTYYWRVRATDLIGNSSWSETRVFFYDLSAPTIDFLNQTGEDNRIINDSNWLNRGENLTIFVNVSDVNTDKVWVVIWQSVIGGVERLRTFFDSLDNFLWRANVQTNQTWEGFYNYTIYANDTLGSQINYSSNFTVLGGNATINITPSYIESISNLTVYGHINLTNTTNLTNYPINLWLDGKLLFISNLTGEGTYDFYREFSETSSSEFSQGTFYNTQIQGNQNITLSSGNTSGNFTKILDAGAMVSWNNLSWIFEGDSCSGVFSYQEGDSNSYSGTRDTYITSGAATTNYGTSNGIIVDGSPTSDRGLIKFDNIIGRSFYQIPENSTIINANLTFYISDTGDQVSVYQILENWTENEATYNNRLTGTAWGSTGCASSPSRSTALEDSFTASSIGAYTINITNSTKSWVSGSQNYGLVFNMPTSNGINIRSSEYSTQSERPLLTVAYQAEECTNVRVYIRTSNNKTTWTSWREISNGGQINDSNIYSRYLEYRVELSSVNSSLTPVLEEIIINYTAITTDSNGNYRYNFTSPSQFGNHNILLNTSFRNIFITNSTNFSVQTGLAPNVSLISPTNNQWFSYGEMNLTYNTTDLNDNFAFSELIINNAINQTNSTVIVNYAYNNFTINFSSGQYNWTVNVTDSTGYRATTAQRTFYIDLIDPNISLIYPGNEFSFDVNELNLSFNATDNMDTNLTCSVVLDGDTLYSGIGAINGNITNVSSGILSGGIHYWNVTCSDNAIRNFTSTTFNFNISDTPPNVTFVSPAPNYLDNDGILSFIYNATDNTGFINCSLYINEVFNQTNSSPINNYGNNAFDVEGILEGNYNWTVECFDLSSSSYKPSPRNFSMDLYKPTITLTSPSNSGTSLTSLVYFNFTVNDTFDSSLDCNLTINGIIGDSFTANSGSPTTRPLYNLTDGLKSWNVTCIDNALHSNTSSTWSMNITESPSVLLNISNNSRFNQTYINFSYTPSDNTNLSSCNIYLNGALNQSNSTPILNNQQNFFNISGVQEGKYDWYVLCTDYFGLSNQSEIRRIYVDLNPPIINISYPKGEDVYASNITFNFTVTDSVELNLSCNLTVNSTVRDINFTVGNNSLISRTISGIGDGYNIWNLTCWDPAGNFNTSDTFNFTRYTNPGVTLFSPENNTWFNSGDLYLIYLPEDDGGIVNASLFINGVYNQSNSSPIINRDYNNFSINGFSDGSYYWNVNVTDPTGLTGIGMERRFYIDSQSPNLILNHPNESSIIITNNVTFNFTVWDLLDSYIDCNFTLDGELESQETYDNASQVLIYSILSDGNHTWKVDCMDNASNINNSDIINFTVEAPPFIELVSPANNIRTTNSTINFSYIPYDLIDITNCSFYLDGIFNQSNISVQENTLNNFTLEGIPEGMHNWTVNCSDSDDNWNWSTERIFYRDISPPYIILNSPDNNSGVDYNDDRVYFNWTAIDALDNTLQCNLTVDGVVRRPNVWVTSNISKREYVLTSVLGQGEHSWNITCWDQLFNTNTSELRKFNLTYPDFVVNYSQIFFNESSPKENESIEITATIYNLASLNISNVTVRFYQGDPDSGGVKIGTDVYINLSNFGYVNVTKNWSSQIGPSEIFIVVDPPTSTNGSYMELNESNNKASKNISIGSWQFFYGDILSFSNIVLAENSSASLVNWSAGNFDEGNVYITDYDSYVSWINLQSLGKTESGGDSSSDFLELDSLLNSTGYTDSVYSVYTNSGTPKYLSNIYSFNNIIQQVPVMNSTNNSNFVTGILWDYSDDTNGTNGEYDIADKEDIIFVAPINKHAEGTYGYYDYEIRVPAKLREYWTTDTKAATFYVEIY
ncbi:MAG: DUF2341 domain-containing protein [Nanobdellota archaeon]